MKVVDRLEAVEVDAQHRERLARAAALVDVAREMVGEDGAVGQAGQRVVIGEMGDPRRRFLALADVADREHAPLGAAPVDRPQQHLDRRVRAPSAPISRHSIARRSRAGRQRARSRSGSRSPSARGQRVAAVIAGEPQEAAIGVDDPLAVDHHQPLDRGVGEGA